MAQTGGFNLPNFVKSYREGEQYGMAKAEQKRKQPLVEQLEGLTLKKSQNAVSLQDIQMKAEQDKVRRNKIKDISNMAKYAQSQPDPSAVFDQGLQFYAQEGDQEALNYLGQWENVGGMLASMNPDDVMGATKWSTTPQTVVVGENEDGTDKLALKVYNNRGGSMFTGDTPMNPYQKAVSSAKGKVIGGYEGKQESAESGNKFAKAELESDKKKAKDTPVKKSAQDKKVEGFLLRMETSEDLVNKIVAEGYKPTLKDRYTAGTGVANWAASEQGQRYWNAAAEWTRAKLRNESGAVIGVEEALEEARTYFPVFGDSKKVIAQKKQLRDTAIQAIGGSKSADYNDDDEYKALRAEYGI